MTGDYVVGVHEPPPLTAEAANAERVQLLVVEARGYVITDDATCDRVVEFLHGVKALRAEVAATFDQHIKRAFDTHRGLVAEKRNAEAQAIEAETIAKATLAAWNTRKEQIASMARAAIDAQRVADAARRVCPWCGDDCAQSWCGHCERALPDADVVPTDDAIADPPLPVVRTKVDGVTFAEVWSARVTDVAALIKFAAANPQYLSLLKVDDRALQQLAKALRQRLQLPGVVVERGTNVRTGRR